MSQKPYSLAIELPQEAFQHHPWHPETLAQELRTLWLMEQVRERRLGYGKAAQLAGIPKALFVRMLGERHISAVDYDDDELAQEFAAADVLVGT
jgi:predicted HTH domain antitoxin